MNEFAAKVRGAGYIPVSLWVARGWRDAIAERARRWQTTRRSILMAALEVGLRHLRSEDVQRTEATWRASAGPSASAMIHAGLWHRTNNGRFVNTTNGRFVAAGS